MADTVLVERTGAVATLTVNRPDKLNALNVEVLRELSRPFHGLLEAAEPVRAAVLTGAGKAFVAGADIAAMSELSVAEAKRFSDMGHRLLAMLEAAPFPVIAAVNGFALGGGLELALACDFIYASANAKLGQPEVNLGVIPGFGGTQRLMRRVGAARARELVYTGQQLTAAEAAAMGLVNKVLPPESLLEEAHKTARTLADKGPLAVAAAKRVMTRAEDVPLGVACELEAQAFAALFGSDDQKLGMRAFLARTPAVFTGR
ncbi:MAG: enoyl-CoA hydratase/isomerase family protein [Myxococcales bacterium]|nr:enoyl-CoA hydratase/isomerase family protein [Myxococcales bacterium]